MINEKLAIIKPISHKMKNLDWLDAERLRNIITAHALKTKLKSLDVRKTLSLYQRRPPRKTTQIGEVQGQYRRTIYTREITFVNYLPHVYSDVIITQQHQGMLTNKQILTIHKQTTALDKGEVEKSPSPPALQQTNPAL